MIFVLILRICLSRRSVLCGLNVVWRSRALPSYLLSLLLISSARGIQTNTTDSRPTYLAIFKKFHILSPHFSNLKPVRYLIFYIVIKTSSRRSWCQKRQLLNSFQNRTCLKVNFKILNWMTADRREHDTISINREYLIQ